MFTFVVPGLLAGVLLQAAPTDTNVPVRRAHHSLAYDEDLRRVVLTGGSSPRAGGECCDMFADVWTFDGARWSRLGITGDPRSGSTLAFDRSRKKLVAFGGYNGRSIGDLRVLVGGAWQPLGNHSEIVAAEPGFVYDTRRNRFVSFGGSSGPGRALGDTWLLSGSQWTKLAASGPPARQSHIMVYDDRRDRVVVYGGVGTAPAGQRSPKLADTWEFDGETWTEKRVDGPGVLSGAGATFDAKRGVVLLFGGVKGEGFSSETWSWDGSVWRKLADTGPEPRGMGYLAYDKQRDRTVMFGGRKGWPDGDLNDTWEWDGTTWRRVAP